jgi:peptidoglycan/LPS O-acetylase OafA/YrhL
MNQPRKTMNFFGPLINEKIKDATQRVNNALGINNNSIFALDGLRAIACLSVLFFHFRWLSSQNISVFPTKGPLAYVTAFFLFGNAGVILFFLLSGFLLFLPFAKALMFEESKWPSVRRFYLRRIFRILPAYYFSLILIVLFTHPEFLHLAQWRVILKFLTFLMNYGPAQQINGVFWTLAVEFQFYLLLPLIVWIMSLFVRHGSVHWRFIKLILCLLAMIGWGLVTRYWALRIVDTTRLDWLLPHSVGVTLRLFLYGDPGYLESGKYFEVFGLGMLVCAFYVYSRNVPQAMRWNRITQLSSPFIGFIGLSSLAFLAIWNLYSINVGADSTLQYLSYAYGRWMNIWLIGRPFFIGLAYALCMFALLHGPKWLRNPFEWNPLRWLGATSYSLYIWHMPLAFLFLGYSFPYLQHRSIAIQSIVSLLWVLVVIIPFSVMVYRYVERSGIRLGESILRRIEKQKRTPNVVVVDLNLGKPSLVAGKSTAIPEHAFPSK